MPQDIGGLLPYPIIHSASFISLVRVIRMLIPYLALKWPEAVEQNSQTVQAVCEGVHAPHGKVETLCYGAHKWMPYLRIRHHLV